MGRRAALLALVLVGFAAAGCGDVVDEPREGGGEPPPATGPAETGPAETGGTAPATTSTEPPSELPDLAPPPIVLESEAGRQEGVQESYCTQQVDLTGLGGTGVCADTPDLDPERLTVVRSGDAVTISMPGAVLSGADAGVTVRPLGCRDRETARVPLGPDGIEWTVDLEPGAYELQVFVRFEAKDGLSGDGAASLGLLVDPEREPAIIKAEPGLFVCPPSEQG